jgi:hypothetical protein
LHLIGSLGLRLRTNGSENFSLSFSDILHLIGSAQPTASHLMESPIKILQLKAPN